MEKLFAWLLGGGLGVLVIATTVLDVGHSWNYFAGADLTWFGYVVFGWLGLVVLAYVVKEH